MDPRRHGNWTKKCLFFAALEEEVSKAELAGRSVIISFDANSKLGPSYIKGDPHTISENGNIFEGVIERHALCGTNGISDKSTGTITRERTTKHTVEKSAHKFRSHRMHGEDSY